VEDSLWRGLDHAGLILRPKRSPGRRGTLLPAVVAVDQTRDDAQEAAKDGE
jgi:hypothetical protein